jgi:photosystem II stability/assembly factor-like uncharacterized protein
MQKMKRVCIIGGLILAGLYDLSAQQWGIAYVQHSRSIYSIVIINPQNITISGGFDYTDPIEAVYHSSDFGLDWPENPSDTISFCVRSIAFADTMHGFGTGFFGGWVHSGDGGHTWTRDTLPVARNFFKAIYATPSIAFMAGGEELGSNMQTILKSINGAAGWSIMRDTAGPVLRSVYFLDSLRGTAVGDTGTILRTIDGGTTWTAVAAPVQSNFNSITFINADTGYIAGGIKGAMQTILRTTDGGATWTILLNQSGPWFADISFLNKDTGYIVGDAATLMRSIDGGQSWAAQTVTSANGGESFTSVRFYNSGFGIIGGLNGGVFIYANPPVPTVQTGNVIYFGNNITLTGATNTHGSPANLAFLIGGDSLFTNAAITPWPQTITSTAMVPAQYGIAGLLGAGTYYYTCVVTNTDGSYHGDTARFTIPDSASVLTALPDTNAGITSLTLRGLVSRMPVSSNIYFEYSINGDTVIHTVAAAPAVINDTLAHNISANITGITTNVQYQYRVKATSGDEVLYSDYLQFNLTPGNYRVNISAANNVNADSATLEGQVSNLSFPSTIWFQYAVNGDTTTVPAVPASVRDTLPHQVSARIGGLMPDSLYQFRVKVLLDSIYPVYSIYYSFYASNLVTGNGIISTNPPTNVTLDSATLQGGVRGISGTATVWFEYSLNGMVTTVAAVPGYISDSFPHNVSARIGGLIPDSLYQFRVKLLFDSLYPEYSSYYNFYASNSLSGNSMVATYPPANITDSSAILQGGVSGISGATVWFEYSRNGVVTTVPAVPGSISDTSFHQVSAQVGGLIAYTQYQYRLKVIVDTLLTVYGNYNTLYTYDAGNFIVAADSSKNVYPNSVQVYGHVSDISVPGQLTFTYWTWSGGFPTLNVPASPGYINDTLTHIVTALLTGLVPNAVYYCYLSYSDSGLINKQSNVLSFYTGVGLLNTGPATNVTLSSATLNGNVSQMTIATSVYFEYWQTGYPVMTVAGTPSAIQDTLFHNISAQVTGLVSNTSYEYRLKLVDTAGRVYYGDSLPVYIGPNTIPNPDFENWSLVSGEKADGWNCFFGPVTKVSPGSSGNYAAYLANTSAGIGIEINAMPNFNGPGNYFSGGFPYAARPDTVSGMFKYNFFGGDSGFVMVIFKSQGQMISQNYYLFCGSSPNNFQQLKFPITYTSGAMPDTLIIGIATADVNAQQVTPVTGCWMIVDDLSFGPSYPPIPNGGFENWQSYTYKNLDDWSYYNMEDFNFYPDPDSEMVIQTTDAEHGLYAADMSNLTIQGMPLTGSLQSYGNMMNKNFPSFPLNHKVQSLNGYYKFFPVNDDTINIECDVYKDGVQIGAGFWWDSQGQSTYAPFNANINYWSNQVPDSCFIIFYIGSQIRDCTGTRLLIDNLSFDGFVSNIEEVNAASSQVNSLKIFPNPSSSMVRIQTSIDIDGRLEIYDMQGMLVFSDRFTGNNQQLDIRNFNPGIYLVRVISGENIMSQRMVIIK